ncbi:hypothetical protein UlMin_009281 [Ulmus minor]
MEEGMRSGGSSGVVVKNRNSSGCLIVRSKGDGLGSGRGSSSSSRKALQGKKEKKRPRLVLSDSGSSDERLVMRPWRVGGETIRVCNDLTANGKGVGEDIGRKRDRLEHFQNNENGFGGRNGFDESERKKSKLDVFEFDEYDGGIDEERMQRQRYGDGSVGFGGRSLMGSMHVARSSVERELETGSSRHVVDKRKNLYFERRGGSTRGNLTDKSRFEINRDSSQLPLLRDKFVGHSDQPIRLQGKNGVLKVMVNKKKNVGGSLENYKHFKTEENLKLPKVGDIAKRNVNIPPFYSEPKLRQKPSSVVWTEKKHMNLRTPLPTRNSKNTDWDSDDSDTSLKFGPENVETYKSKKRVSLDSEDAPSSERLHPNKIKEGKVRRGSGTEKQKLREKIRGMLVDAGWTIDYRPRKNRDYLDAVYINPSGTAYWSIIKAYAAFQKQVNEEDNETKPTGDGSSFRLIADEDLSQLTRKTRKKMEKEMKRKQRDGSESENAREVGIKRSSSTKHDSESMDSVSHDDKLSSFIKQGGKSFKSRMNENGMASVNSNGQNATDHSHLLHGRKSKKLGRCTLLVRNKGLNSETDGFVPYKGKRTLLSWLIDSGAVQLSQKVQYKNRRKTRVMLEGWITRDGIHCGCCSKILTISKFEIHAGSKLRQPYQNIYLDSGVSLLQCQIDAWNRQEDSERIGFHSVDSVDTDGDDPNDDTCGICGDGGDLICCDSCPSTFHQSCLDIEMLPPGDWHCPNCTCKVCGVVSENVAEDETTISEPLTCSLCEKKYHISCVQDTSINDVDSNSLFPSFCGQKCKELFEHLQKYIGIKHDLEAGFSWSLVRRTDEDSDISHRGAPPRVESNSKLAVALTVMDECFLPIVDRRSGINLIRNVLYNCGSNFNRLNYAGFYTAILEKGDEIISAASLRFHGTKLAEMPFIGTRHIYRRQGMCRRLFCAIESALCSLKVERLIIPAISELMHTWTVGFGFTPLEDSLKQEMRAMNMLVFPGIDMIQKLIVEKEHESNLMTSKDLKQTECKEVAVKSEDDPCRCDDNDLHHSNETTPEVAEVDSGSQGQDVSSNDTPAMNGSSDFSPELKNTDSIEGTVCPDSPPEAKVSHDTLGAEKEPVQDPFLEDNTQTSLHNAALISSSEAKCDSESKCLSPHDMPHDELDLEINQDLYSLKDNTESSKENGMSSSLQGPLVENNVAMDSSPKAFKENGANDFREMDVDNTCHEPGPSSGNTLAENIEEVSENPDITVSSLSDPNESSLIVKSDLAHQNDCVKVNKLHATPEAASDAIDCE